MTLLVACLAAVAAALMFPPKLRVASTPAAPVPRAGDDPGLLHRWRMLWVPLAFAGGAAFVPGPLALPAGLAVGTFVWLVATRAEPPARRRRSEEARRQLPHLVELYAAALAAGASTGPALGQVRAALPGAAADELAGVQAGLDLGRPPHEVWSELADHPALGPLGRAMARAQVSGAPVVEAVRLLADELAERARAEVEDRARTVGVKAAVPLGLCLLPAFLLLGIVPLVAGAVTAIDW